MAATFPTTRKPSGKILALILAPLLIVVLIGAVIPRLHSNPEQPPGRINWTAMHGYELSVARKYPHLRRGYERALARDRIQLAALNRRITVTGDPDIRTGLEQQRLMVTSGISTVQQILAHFPAKEDNSQDNSQETR